MTRILSAAAVALCLAISAHSPRAQTAAPITNLDHQFLVKDAQGGAYEIAIAALAQQRSSRDDVKAYAARIIADHAAYNQALQELARAKGIELPTTMTAEIPSGPASLPFVSRHARPVTLRPRDSPSVRSPAETAPS